MRRVLQRALLALLVLAGGLFIVFLGTVLFGHVHGEEFAPDTFERRAYSYFELPVARMQVTPVRRSVSRPDLEQALVDRHYITVKNPPERWDFVVSYRVGETWREGDARILSQYLDAWSSGGRSSHWLDWTTDHPELAEVLWPEIAKLARQELYLFVPDLFRLAAEQTDGEAFQADLKRVLARKYEELAQVEAELQNFAAAVRFYTEALSYEPNREASLEGRSRARAALGPASPAPSHGPPLPAGPAEDPALPKTQPDSPSHGNTL